jgi:CheY-like chemotaxis protein
MAYKNILLVDDDMDDQEIFLTAVSQLSDMVDCTALSDATDALHKLGTGDIEPDVIFLDLNMPVMNGQQFLTAIKKNTTLSAIPVIIFSTSSDPATIALTRQLGASDFITKPSTFDALVAALSPLF